MLQQNRERLVLLLIGLLPFHAYLITVFTKLLQGPGNPPWSVVALWKEAVLGIILFIALWEVLSNVRTETFDVIDWFVATFIFLSCIVSIAAFNGLKPFLLGVKYDLLPLVAFALLRHVQWSEGFMHRLLQVVLSVGIAVAAYGVLSFFLPMSFFVTLGYSDLHSLYLPTGPLAAFQQIGESGLRRIQSTMSGPNQLGLWLLIPWSICVVGLFRALHHEEHVILRFLRIVKTHRAMLVLYILFCFLLGTALFLTFSRSAWISAVVLLFVAVSLQYSTERAERFLVRLVAPLVFGISLFAFLYPQAIFRSGSTSDHFLKPLYGIQEMIAHPLGQGLGSAGPASNHVSDACVFLDADADVSWAADRPTLCVFAGGIQVQPSTRGCTCPFVTENWYVQIGVELGLVGFVLYLTFVALLLHRLWQARRQSHTAVFLSFFGVSLAGMFLHSWEDAAIAYTIWILLALQLRMTKRQLVPLLEKE